MKNNDRAAKDQKRQDLQQELSQLDKTITDFCHLFEFGHFPDDVLLNIYKEFVIALRKRRTCKNRLRRLQTKSDTRYFYSPRILTNEFVLYREYLTAR